MITNTNQIDILKLITAGSVDDGKSTLIGRLLYDSKSILADQLEAIEKSSKNKEHGNIDLALLTDGLRAEREQGITIDVAYRYFATTNRKFIIADTPGHIQYTRNMITGASNVDLAIIIIDARQGIVEQTRRHSLLVSLLKIKHVAVAINKIDLIDYNEDAYNNIVIAYNSLAKQINLQNVSYFPVSALHGDNIVNLSTNTTWYNGKTLLQYLETVNIAADIDLNNNRFQVQYVIRPQTHDLHDYRGYAGKIVSGIYKKGDAIKIFPTGYTSTIEKIEVGGNEVATAFAPQSITISLTNDIDISRGDSIVKQTDNIIETKNPKCILCWLGEKPMQLGNKYILQQQHRNIKVAITNIDYKLDINTYEQITQITEVKLNEIVQVDLLAAQPLLYDAFAVNSATGAAILIDETSNKTVAAVLFQ